MNQFQISIVQGSFTYESCLTSVNPIDFEVMSKKALTTLIKGMLIAKMDYPSASLKRKDKEGNILEIIQRRAKVSEPFEVYIEHVVEGESLGVVVADKMKFNLTEKSIKKTLLNLPKRLWLMANDKLLESNPLLAFQAPEYYSKQLIG